MALSISDSWSHIETWLEENTPGTLAALAAPADRALVLAAERAVGRPFPASLTESLLRHNGTGHAAIVPPFWQLLDVNGIVDAWRTLTAMTGGDDPDDEFDDPDAGYGRWWSRAWTPFAETGCGDYLALDQRPNRHDRVVEADHENGSHFDRHPMWASLPALLEATATALWTGRTISQYKRFVDDEGRLAWDIV